MMIDAASLLPLWRAALMAETSRELLRAVAQGAYDLAVMAQDQGMEGAETLVEHAGAMVEAADALPTDEPPEEPEDALPEDAPVDSEPMTAAGKSSDWWTSPAPAPRPPAPTKPRTAPAPHRMRREAPHQVDVRRITVHTRSLDLESTEGAPKRRLVVASTASVDRYGDIVDQRTLRLDSYRANPILLWNHQSSEVVGRAVAGSVEVRDVDGKPALVFEPEWDTDETNPIGRRVASQWERGFLRCVSIGFGVDWERARRRCDLPKDHPAYGERGMYFEAAEIMEISPVSIPANTDAKNRPDLS